MKKELQGEDLASVQTTFPIEGVAQITFSHPAHNALPGRLLAELESQIERAGRDERARVIVLASGGDRTFCAGASFDELLAIGDPEAGKDFFMGFARVINAMRRCPKFIMGRVQGKAVGGGVGLAAATDYCLASTYASVKLSELAIGIGPFVVGPAVARKIGQAGLAELAVDAESWRTAEWAHRKGLFAALYEQTEALDAAVATLADRLAGYNPEAMRALKQTFWYGTDHWDVLLEERAALSGKLVLSEHTAKALQSYRARRNH